MPSIIAVKHNIEVAHRLLLLPGKCENIHGHSMWVTLELKGELNQNGILEGIEFGALKKDFRDHLDSMYDHHLLLNATDPWSDIIVNLPPHYPDEHLPGLHVFPGDPTTENIAKWIGEFMWSKYYHTSAVTVWETAVNMARWEA